MQAAVLESSHLNLAGLLRDWHSELRTRPMNMELLRVCKSPRESACLEPTEELMQKLRAGAEEYDHLLIAALAALAANVDCDDRGKDFITRLASGVPGGSMPGISEHHFMRLCTSAPLDAVFRRMRRAVLVLRRRADLATLAQCLLSWHPADPMHERYALDKEEKREWKERYERGRAALNA